MNTKTKQSGWLLAAATVLLVVTVPVAHADGMWGYAPVPGIPVMAPAAYYQAYGYGPGWREHEWREHEWREHEWREHAWGGDGWREGGWRRGGDWHGGGWGREGGWRR